MKLTTWGTVLLSCLGTCALSPIWVMGCGTCVVNYHMYNHDRRIFGTTLTQECPGGMHSAPFGNWGISASSSDGTAVASKYDGHQFDGWKVLPDGPWYQWNSCTSDQENFPLGNPAYYNSPVSGSQAFTRQYTTTGLNQFSTVLQTKRYVVSCVSQGPTGPRGGCKEVDGAKVIRDVTESLYELDPFDPIDDFVTNLTYQGFTNRLEMYIDCDAYGCASPYTLSSYAQNNGVGAWSTMIVIGGGFTGGDCEDEEPPRQY